MTLAVMVVLGAVAALLLVEALLRGLRLTEFSKAIGGWTWQVYDPVTGWKNQPGYRDHSLEINSLSFRGADLARRKPPGTLRIACLGDSGTFGIWVEGVPVGLRFDNYPEALGRLLRQRGAPRVEVINCGVLGYSTSHGLRQLLTRVAELSPDIVTVRLGFNDHSMCWHSGLRAEEPASPLLRSLLYRFWRWGLFRLGLALVQRLHVPDPTVRWATPERFAANLRRFVAVARERGYKLLFVDYPLRALERGESIDTETPYGLLGVESLDELHRLHGSYQEVLRRVTAEEGALLADTGAVLQACPEETFSDYDLVHPNDRGAELIARTLLDRIEAEGWLGAPAASGPASDPADG
ncbi:MAG: SGNH/GDSL hydrolase family protein [Thermoanaerobaculia bacterium]